MLSHLNAQFFRPPEPFGIDHIRYEESVSWTPGSSRQTVRIKIRPAFLDILRCQHFHREAKALLHVSCRLCMLPVLCYLVSSARLPYRDRLGILVEEQVAVLSHHWLLTDICRAV